MYIKRISHTGKPACAATIKIIQIPFAIEIVLDFINEMYLLRQ